MSNIRYNGFKLQITGTANVKTAGKASVENAGGAGSAGGVTGSSAPKSINTKVYTPNAPTQDNGGVMLTSNAKSGGSTVTTCAPVQTPTCSSDVVTPTTPAVGDMDVTGSNQVTGSNDVRGNSGLPDNFDDLTDDQQGYVRSYLNVYAFLTEQINPKLNIIQKEISYQLKELSLAYQKLDSAKTAEEISQIQREINTCNASLVAAKKTQKLLEDQREQAEKQLDELEKQGRSLGFNSRDDVFKYSIYAH